MDPISVLFAALLNSTASAISDHMVESLGAEVKNITVVYGGQSISYKHQMWRIKYDSVCKDKKERIDEFSKCTLAAKEHFSEACQYLQREGGNVIRNKQLKNMYCSASNTFRPTVASIVSVSEVSHIEQAKRKCNILTFDKSASEESRKQACARYEELKRQE